MRRAGKRRRDGLTRRSRKDEPSSLLPILAIAAVIAAFAGIAIFAFQVVSERAEIDELTLCQQGPSQNQVAVLLDLTDPLSQVQARRLVTILDEIVERSAPQTLVAVGVVSQDRSQWGAEFQKCKPQTGDRANELYQNPMLIAERFEAEFKDPLSEVISAMMMQSEQETSPIMEALQTLLADLPRREGRLSLIIVSDLLQNSEMLSVYRNETWSTFEARGGSDRLARNLAGSELTIIRIPRPEVSSERLRGADAFWAEYFDIQGAKAPFDVLFLGDL